MITRQRLLLRLLELEGGSVSKFRLFKLAFLLRDSAKDAPTSAFYQFLPYQFGPYSFTMNHELRSLERHGWLRVLDADIAVSRSIKKETDKLEKALSYAAEALVERYRSMTTDAVIDEVYRRFPWYTARARNAKRRAATIPIAPNAVYTVGYEGLMLDGLLDLLLQTGIKRLVDVRCNPVARRFGFHKSTMECHCKDVGISYVHVPELGIPSSWRQDLCDSASYDQLFVRYEEEILPRNDGDIARACAMVDEMPTAFMCMESDSRCCHRTRLARVVAARTKLPPRELRCQ